MEQAEPARGPQPPGAFAHPGATALREESSDVSPGFDDQPDDASAAAEVTGDYAAVMPPRAAGDVRREPLVAPDQATDGEG